MDDDLKIDRILAPGGLVAQKLPGYEARAGQIEMAVAVEQALKAQKHLDIEAPCGVGKTFSYLLPLILECAENKKTAVVCTANIALQEQLIDKDLPFLKKILPVPFTYTLAKGMGNYLCLDRLHHARDSSHELSDEAVEELRGLDDWTVKTQDGDKSEIALKSDLWPAISGNSDLCNGRRCDDYVPCFIMKARRTFKTVHVVICNYHLFFANASIRMESGLEDPILPEFDYVVCDEAHEAADIARDYFGLNLKRGSVKFLKRADKYLGDADLMQRIGSANAEFFDSAETFLKNSRNKKCSRFTAPGTLKGDGLAAAVSEYAEKTEAMFEGTSKDDKEKRGALEKCMLAAHRIAGAAEGFMTLENTNMTYFVEESDGRISVRSKLIDVGAVLKSELFDRAKSVISTSATLTDVGKSFSYFDRERGKVQGERQIVESPFNFKKQCLIVTPNLGIVDPNAPGFVEGMAAVISHVITELDGRTMCLFTSYKNLKACAEIAKRSTDIEILQQGDAPRMKLLERLKTAGRGVALFGTDSFWQGVDVPGQALSCLTIDKIPFEPPDDPVLQAMGERDAGLFMNVSLPRATIKLRQGFGRLIRTLTDVGAVVLFDPRLLVKPYGKRILTSLPECRLTADVEEIFALVPPVEVKEKA